MSQQIPSIEEMEAEAEKSELFQQVLKLKPRYASNSEALAAAQNELQNLADSAGLSIEQFLQEAETSIFYKKSYLDALALHKRLNFFKSQIK